MKNILTALSLSVLLSSAAFGQSIGVSFGADTAGGGDASLEADDTAGVVSQANWNNASDIAGSLTDAVDGSGAASTLDVAWATDESWSWNTPLGSSDGELMSGWISQNTIGEVATLDISEIPFANYDLYIYQAHDRVDNDVTFSESNGAFSAITNEENVTPEALNADPFLYTSDTAAGVGNFIHVPGLSADTLNIEFSGTSDRAGFAGFQIVAVPEPSAVVSLGIAFGVLALFRRRK